MHAWLHLPNAHACLTPPVHARGAEGRHSRNLRWAAGEQCKMLLAGGRLPSAVHAKLCMHGVPGLPEEGSACACTSALPARAHSLGCMGSILPIPHS